MADASLLERIDDALASPVAIRLLGQSSVTIGDVELVVLNLLLDVGLGFAATAKSDSATLVRERISQWREAAWPRRISFASEDTHRHRNSCPSA